jgi:hypothetical protein
MRVIQGVLRQEIAAAADGLRTEVRLESSRISPVPLIAGLVAGLGTWPSDRGWTLEHPPRPCMPEVEADSRKNREREKDLDFGGHPGHYNEVCCDFLLLHAPRWAAGVPSSQLALSSAQVNNFAQAPSLKSGLSSVKGVPQTRLCMANLRCGFRKTYLIAK